MSKPPTKPPTKQQLQHAQKITHRAADGTFKDPPHKPAPAPAITAQKNQPAELDQDAGSRYDSSGQDFPQA